MKRTLLPLVIAAFMVCACADTKKAPETAVPFHYDTLPGDSTLYGLAGDGTTDSILIMLPYSCEGLDTFDIIEAREQRRIMGRPHIGDELAVILRNDSTQQAALVVNVSTLQQKWCYMAQPVLRHQPPRPLPDSVMRELMTPREYTLRLMRGGTAFTMGGRHSSSDTMSPVEYPQQKRYTGWRLFNGRLLLTVTDSTSQQAPDTADIVLLRRDSLVLRFSDHEQAYYRQEEAAKNEK